MTQRKAIVNGCKPNMSTEDRRSRATRHGMCYTRTYASWGAMKSRCLRPSNPSYPRYGGAGVVFCEEWDSFDCFFADMGVRPAGTSLDRIDRGLPYSKDNCRWATPKEQARNKKDNYLVEWMGRVYCVSELAEAIGMNVMTLGTRFRRGWSTVDAITRPVQKRRA